jgi:cytochrome c biogenesis protein CcdA/thiol-disulfide isomerase/thioredoxin
MLTLALIGLAGGLITGISPCILPVLPVIFLSGSTGTPETATRTLTRTLRPYLVIVGLVLSFSLVTLAGSALLSFLRLPQDAIRWVALVALVAIGLGLIFPKVEELLEKPFAKLPQKQIATRSNGFGLGLTLGVLYVPCAGPVLAAIVVAGATGSIGAETMVLTLGFAIGAAVPLLFFALAGQRVSTRVAAFRTRQRQVRVNAGVVTILLAIALVFNVPAALQRAVPDYTAGLQDRLDTEEVGQKLDLGGLVNDQNAQLSQCTDGAAVLESCGAAPDVKGITAWLNTPDGAPVDLVALRGKVVLVDFWAYSCINCQRAAPHLVDWYDAYRDKGFEIIGVHTPEYAFEKVQSNVIQGARDLGITYPVALDNSFSTWTNYRNRYWPAKYLIDAEGTVRHIKLGEGDYAGTESLIRQLLTDADPDVTLPESTENADTTPESGHTPETYLSVGKMVNYAGVGRYQEGTADFDVPTDLAADSFALQGPWLLDYQGATAVDPTSAIALNYRARDVYVVAGGTGALTVTRDGRSTTTQLSGPPQAHRIVTGDAVTAGHIDVRADPGLQVFSFTYG